MDSTQKTGAGPERVPWTQDEGGAIDCARAALAVKDGRAGAGYLCRILFEVWAEAYATGWSDGRADRDQNILTNPYTPTPAAGPQGGE